ncbi:hypothetical protein PAXRUDRAFT_156066 [Paxillus rubicundulus Ve08.2h10]|uniref:Uncharacterized protein n=1 Tax=Paxillus rubicundulus Ve08.2h10 TaxID=930991 RepID=A0A0D0DQ99_9AGAM|nr:hypothetical protein PAXRUDRAFT_156066 [Paxillus rubicundulus Ve08.2h10]
MNHVGYQWGKDPKGQYIDGHVNGPQAAWAARKYQGHRVLPSMLMADLDIAKAKEGLTA